MGKYLINGSKYEIDDSIQGDDLDRTLKELSAPADQAAPAASKNARIDAYLAETDRMLKLTPGTSARQIEQESGFNPAAVSPKGARGLAQVMPTTLATLSTRLKRPLDPHNEDDALAMHRELMRENMAKFGNEADALRAYNGGWTPAKWGNPETTRYVEKILGKGKTPYVPFATVRDKVDPATLNADQDWLAASRQLYSLRERKGFVGKDDDLADWGKSFMGNFNSNMVDMTRYAADLARNGSDDDKRAFLFMMDTYDNTEWSWEGAGRALKGMATDPTNLVGLSTLGIGTVPKIVASAAAKQGIKKLLLTGLGRTGIVAGVESGIMAGVGDAIHQGVEVGAGRKETGSFGEALAHTAIGAAAGVVLGTAGDAAVSAISGVIRRNLPKKAPVRPLEERIEPTLDGAPPVDPAAPTAPPVVPPEAPVAHAPPEAPPAALLDVFHGTQHPTVTVETLSNTLDIGPHFTTTRETAELFANHSGKTGRVLEGKAAFEKPLDLPDLASWFPTNLAEAIDVAHGIKPGADGMTPLQARIWGLMEEARNKYLDAQPEWYQKSRNSFGGKSPEIMAQEKEILDAAMDAGNQAGYAALKKHLAEQGYDSIRYKNLHEGAPVDTYIALDLKKVKDAAHAAPTPKAPDAPNPQPGRVLTDAEIAAATARKQKGRLWVDDLAPIEGANHAAAADIQIPYGNRGLRSTPRSMEELTADGMKIADQLRDLDDKTLHGVLESFRQGSLPLEESRVVARGVQIHGDELRVEQAELIKKLGLSTNAQETIAMLRRLEAVENRLVPLSLADDAFGSMAGSMLRQRQEGLPGLQGVTVESLMADRGLTKEAAEATYVQLVNGSRQQMAVQQIERSYAARIEAALARGDLMEVSVLSANREREMAALVERDLPGSASFMAKLLELMISNVFTPTTVAINLVPAAVKTLLLPAAKMLVSDPLSVAARKELVASYSAMASTVGAAFRAARAAYRYEQSLITRGTGRILEGEMALTGKTAGYIRFFPRVLNATDEFLAQINYASFVSGGAAADAASRGVANGLSGDALDTFVKDATKAAMAEAYAQRSGEALVQPLINKGVNLGLSGEELLQYVEREAMRDPEALRHGSDEEALDLVRDVLYKRKFSGDGTASGLAQSSEQLMNKTPSLKLVLGQLFFRTPIRVFEEGVRLTPGLQFLAPNFLGDLRGANGMLPQARAQAEAMTSLALTGAILSLYASGKVTGDGAYANWRAQRTAGDGPAQPQYSIRMADGSTWSYRNFDPIATPFKIIINGLERMDKLAIRQAQGEFIDQSAWDQGLAYLTVGTSAIASALRDANLVAGVDQMIKLGENLGDPEAKEGAWVKWIGEKISMLVPNTLHKLAKQNDPTLKDPVQFWQVVETRLASIHVDREEIKTAYSYDVLGNVRQLTDTGSLWNIFSTASPQELAKGHSEESQRVMLELDRLQRETGAVFSPPLKHQMTGDFDLRTVLTKDGKETLYDRWQENYRALQPDHILFPIVTAEMPDGTFKHKAMRVETVTKVMTELRDAAFKQTMSQEQAVLDQVMKLELDKAKAKSGLLDFSNRNK